MLPDDRPASTSPVPRRGALLEGPTSEVVARSARPDDSAQVVHLLAQLGYDVDQAAVENAISDGEGVLVTEMDGEVVGLLTYNTRRHLQRNGKVTTIDALVVDETVRSAGIGNALVDHLVVLAREEGCESIELHSHMSRVDARRFYERAGFELTSNFFRMVL